MKIDINDKTKRYITRSGRDVELWSDKGAYGHPILGAIVIEGVHHLESWGANGLHSTLALAEENHAHDLLEFTVKEGMEYQTRTGRQAKVTTILGSMAHGIVWIEVTKSWKEMVWHANGFAGAARNHPMDIMP